MVALPKLAREAAAASLAVDDLYVFAMQAWPWIDPSTFVDNWHIGCMCEYLEAVTDGEIPRLMINVPPGHQKSLTVSVFWPAWTWIARPSKRFMSTAYRGDLALRDATKSRDLIRSPWYQRHFGERFTMQGAQDTKSRYANDRGGYRFSTSTSGIMGEGGDFVILDDPHNVDQAESENQREDTVDKIKLALPTRVRSKDGGIVVIMQRLHERDFCGQMMADEPDQWVHLCLPARFDTTHPFISLPLTLPSGRELSGDQRADDGDLLFPELFDEARLRSLELTLGAYGLSGQLQQDPKPRAGGMFERGWFADKFIDEAALPKGRVVCRGWDLAGTDKKTSPWTAGVRLSRHGNHYYIEHAIRERRDAPLVKPLVVSTAEADGKGVICDIPQDPGQAGKAQVRDYAKSMQGVRLRWSPETGSKVTRAEPFSAQCKAGNVSIVRGDWNSWYLDDLAGFPTGAFVDATDATSRAYARLLQSGGTASSGAIDGAS